MGMFDFLKDRMAPQAGGVVAPVGGRDHQLQLPPTMQKQPGLFSRMVGTDSDGAGLRDRMMMALIAAQGDPMAAIQMRQGLRKETTDKAERQRRNEALKAAYQNGKFDPQAYIDGVGDSGDATDAFDIAKVLKPDRRVVSNSRGIYEVEDGQVNALQEFPEEPDVSPGWQALPDGTWAPIKNGPYDPEYIAKVGGVRRDAVVSRPMPRAAGGGRGGGGLPPPPSGWAPVR